MKLQAMSICNFINILMKMHLFAPYSLCSNLELILLSVLCCIETLYNWKLLLKNQKPATKLTNNNWPKNKTATLQNSNYMRAKKDQMNESSIKACWIQSLVTSNKYTVSSNLLSNATSVPSLNTPTTSSSEAVVSTANVSITQPVLIG